MRLTDDTYARRGRREPRRRPAGIEGGGPGRVGGRRTTAACLRFAYISPERYTPHCRPATDDDSRRNDVFIVKDDNVGRDVRPLADSSGSNSGLLPFFGACDTCDTGEGPYDQKHSFDACFCLSGPSLKSKAGLPPGRG